MEVLHSPHIIAPEIITPDSVRGLSLHDVTLRYGTNGLQVRLDDTLERTGLAEDPGVQWAVQFSHMLHADQQRTNGHYSDHVMRVTLRIIEKFHIVDAALTIGALLHDGPIEDHPIDTVFALTGERVEDLQKAREMARHLIALNTSEEAAEIVWDMATPLTDKEGEDAWDVYRQHVIQTILAKPKPRVNKLSDFVDNGVGNHYTIGPKQAKLDRKYMPLWRPHMMGLYLPDSLITGERREAVLRQLRRGHARALTRVALAGSQELL